MVNVIDYLKELRERERILARDTAFVNVNVHYYHTGAYHMVSEILASLAEHDGTKEGE